MSVLDLLSSNPRNHISLSINPEQKMSNIQKTISSMEVEQKDDQFEEFFQSLPKVSGPGGFLLANYQGSWFHADLLRDTISFQKTFKANDTDIILATMPKSGTTWLKALAFSIVNRKNHSVAESPLLCFNPHQLIHALEDNEASQISQYTGSVPCPRIFSTHLPYQCLPSTIIDSSNCRIIYLCRNPLDIFNSLLHFALQNGFISQQPQESLSNIDAAFETFCQGAYQFGPFWDHVLGYWKASLKNPKKVLFLKYEDLKADISASVKTIADFLGYPFSAEEENAGLVEEITLLCSIENLKNLECNKQGETKTAIKMKHTSFFRKGEVGDWVNFLPPSMAERLENLTKEKFAGSGLTLEIHGKSTC